MTQDLAAKRARYRLKIRERVVIIEQALLHGLKPTAQRFRLNRKTVREWRDRFRVRGPDGLIPQYPDRKRRRIAPEVFPLVEHARRELRYGGIAHQDVVAAGPSDQHYDQHHSAHLP